VKIQIQELQDRKKINRLLNLCGVSEEEITYFVKEPPGVGIVPQKVSPVVVNEQRSSSSHKSMFVLSFDVRILFIFSIEDLVEKKSSNVSPQIRDNETLLLQIEALQAQLEEQTKLAKEQIESLLEDRRVRIEEYDVQRKRDEERLKQTQEK
jgi:coiled-coil domain-containing protein 77